MRQRRESTICVLKDLIYKAKDIIKAYHCLMNMEFEARRFGLPLRACGLCRRMQAGWPQIFYFGLPARDCHMIDSPFRLASREA